MPVFEEFFHGYTVSRLDIELLKDGRSFVELETVLVVERVP